MRAAVDEVPVVNRKEKLKNVHPRK